MKSLRPLFKLQPSPRPNRPSRFKGRRQLLAAVRREAAWLAGSSLYQDMK